MRYKELEKLNNEEIKEYLSKMNKAGLVDYYFKNLPTAINKAMYLRKSKQYLINMILNHYMNLKRDEAMKHIIV